MMVTGHCRLLQQTDPRKVRLEYGKRLWNEVFDHNPRIARYEEVGDFQVYHPRVGGLRPYCSGKTINFWRWCEYKPLVGEIYFQPDELEFAAQYTPDVVIEPNTKGGASPNKRWGIDRWMALIDIMKRHGMTPVQLGPDGIRRMPGAQHIVTPNFRLAAAVLARARSAVLHEGGMHHAAAAVGVPSVVIYGGYISPKQTGYDMHANLFTGGEPCGMRIPCSHCDRAMRRIEPERVLQELKRLIAARVSA